MHCPVGGCRWSQRPRFHCPRQFGALSHRSGDEIRAGLNASPPVSYQKKVEHVMFTLTFPRSLTTLALLALIACAGPNGIPKPNPHPDAGQQHPASAPGGPGAVSATGSKVSMPPIPGLAETPFWTSDDVLDLDFIPKSIVVLGGGIVACELAQFLNRIGTRVILIQRGPHLLRHHSAESAQVVRQAFIDEGIEIFSDTQLLRVRHDTRGTTVEFLHDGRRIVRRAAHLFNALGREPDTASLNLAAAGVKAQANGQIAINRWQQTSAPHIYAAGDCSGPVEIVHVAIQQGELAARHAAGVKRLKPIDWSLLLGVVFTDPQLATIGLSERELDRRGAAYLTASYPFNDHGKSILMDANYGYVKVLAEPRRGRILGAEIVGKDAGELIHCFSGPLALKATVFDLLRAPWYHPTLAEIITYPMEDIADQVNAACDAKKTHDR